jgi:hypothetical protein
MTPFLARWYSQKTVERLGQATAALLGKLVRRYSDKPFTLGAVRADVLKTRNNLMARRFVEDLLRYAYVREHPERLQSGGRPAVQYVVAGAARLAGEILSEVVPARKR